MIFWVISTFVLFLTTLVLAFKYWLRGEYIYETAWAVEEARDEASVWEERVAETHKHRKRWRREARASRHIIAHLERERHDLNNQLHYMSLAYERLIDAIYRGRRPGQVIPLDLPLNKRKAPTPGIPARRL